MEAAGLFLGSIVVVLCLPTHVSKGKISKKVKMVPKGAQGDAVIKEEMYSRISSFFGENYGSITESFVVIVGLGGVGSHATNMLVRSGVTNIRVIDFDQVTLSSLNRHAMATLSDVGKPKAEVMKRRIQEVAPWCRVDSVVEMFKGTEANRLLQGAPTFVLDCIDDVTTKAELIAYCLKNDLRVITSMGAGGKADPTRLRVSPLSDCMNDPLASKIKWKLKKHGVSAEEVMSVFSIEKPTVDLLPLDAEQAANPQDFGTMDYLRVRVMPVLGTSPAIFGQALASKVLCTLAKQEFAGEVCERMSKNLKHKLLQTLRSIEMRRFGSSEQVDIDDEDIEFMIAQVWGSRCAITGRRFGGHAPLMLVRWDRDAPPCLDNLVLMTKPHAEKVEAGDKEHRVPACFEADVKARIEDRLAWARTVAGSDKAVSGGTGAMRPWVAAAAAATASASVAWIAGYRAAGGRVL